MGRTFVRFGIENSCLSSGIFTASAGKWSILTLRYVVHQKELLGHATLPSGATGWLTTGYNIENKSYIS